MMLATPAHWAGAQRPCHGLADRHSVSCHNLVMTKTELHDLVESLPENALDGAGVLLHSLANGKIDPDQAWFWTSEWLAGELEADRQAQDDPGEIYEDAEAFKAALQAVRRG
jgi:hypothetical protein